MANANKPIDGNGLLYIWQKFLTKLTGKVDKVEGKGLSTNDYTTDEKNKLAGIDEGANKYTHPSYTAKTSGLYKVTVDATGHVSAATAATKADITGLGIPEQDTTYSTMGGATSAAAGSEGLVPAPAAGKQASFLRGDGTWAVPANTTYSAATVGANGLMSSTDKAKLDGIEESANNYTHPAYTARTGAPTANQTPAFGGTFSVSQPVSDATGHITAMNSRTITIPSTAATTSAAGLMSAADKAKLDAFSAASEYAKKSDLANVYVYKGSVATYADLPTTGLTAGDVYNVEADGMNYAWTGTAWDALGMVLEIEYLTNAEIDEIIGA